MDEAKTLTNMAVNAMLASLFLAAAVGLVTLGYSMWSYFSRQDMANSRMADYANYAAFDNTTVRGQEVLSLIESDPDLFILILNSTNYDITPIHIDDLNIDSNYPIAAIYYSDAAFVKDFDLGAISNTDNVIKTCSNALSAAKDIDLKISDLDNKYSLNAMKHSELVTAFTSGYAGAEGICKLGSNRKKEGNEYADEDNSYAAFKSVLVYDETNGTNDVVGIILVRPIGWTVY